MEECTLWIYRLQLVFDLKLFVFCFLRVVCFLIFWKVSEWVKKITTKCFLPRLFSRTYGSIVGIIIGCFGISFFLWFLQFLNLPLGSKSRLMSFVLLFRPSRFMDCFRHHRELTIRKKHRICQAREHGFLNSPVIFWMNLGIVIRC